MISTHVATLFGRRGMKQPEQGTYTFSESTAGDLTASRTSKAADSRRKICPSPWSAKNSARSAHGEHPRMIRAIA